MRQAVFEVSLHFRRSWPTVPVDQLAVADQPTGSRCLQRAHSAFGYITARALKYDPVGQPAGDLPNALFSA